MKDEKMSIITQKDNNALKNKVDTFSRTQRKNNDETNLIHTKRNIKKQLKKKKLVLLKTKERLDETLRKLVVGANERKDAVDKCKVARRRALDASVEVARARGNVQRAHLMLRNIMPRNEVIGLHALNRIVREEGVICGQQYFGPVIGNITLVDASFYRAVEAAANNALFHVIVDTRATAMKLIKRLENEGRGQVIFLPLDQLNNNSITTQYPDTPDNVPLMEKCLKYNPKLENAILHVFGKKLFAESISDAHDCAMRYKMDVVTLEGNLYRHEGVLSCNNIGTSNRYVIPCSSITV